MTGRIMSLGMSSFLCSKVKRTDYLIIKIIAQDARIVGWLGISIPSSCRPGHGGTEKLRDWLKLTCWLLFELRLHTFGLTLEPKFLTTTYYGMQYSHMPYENRLIARFLSVANTVPLLLCLY